MKSTLLSNDVELLLEDVTNNIPTVSIEIREELIRSGKKAYDMIPFENIPTNDEIYYYEKALEISALDTAFAVCQLAEKIYKAKGENVVLVSLIRGGIPAGILIKRYLERKYNIKVLHYAITLIGTKGIDERALEYILKQVDGERIQFIDGWTGKGAVNNTLKKSLLRYKNVSPNLAVLSDPANILELSGTSNDILIANACLNSILSGLISRAIPLENSFFGAVFFEGLIEYDRTYHFIETIDKITSSMEYKECYNRGGDGGIIEIKNIANIFGVSDVHFIKPGSGETFRAFIRKKPDIILLRNEKNKYTELMREIAIKNNIEIFEFPLIRYNMCGIYKDSSSDVL